MLLKEILGTPPPNILLSFFASWPPSGEWLCLPEAPAVIHDLKPGCQKARSRTFSSELFSTECFGYFVTVMDSWQTQCPMEVSGPLLPWCFTWDFLYLWTFPTHCLQASVVPTSDWFHYPYFKEAFSLIPHRTCRNYDPRSQINTSGVFLNRPWLFSLTSLSV